MADDHPSAIAGVFGRPFTEQVAFFRGKVGNQVPTQRWDDLEGAEHDDAFMVAGAFKADLLNDLAAATDKAIAEGRGIEEFRRDFRAIVAQNGWTGWTGEGSVKGEAWRVKTILSTNAFTSYAAGRHVQLLSGDFALWVYRHGGSKEPRPQHLDWDGLFLPPGHTFWATFYPPSDWGCSCYVLGASSERAAIRLGGDPQKKLAADWQKPDPRTGLPAGAGRGWNYAPGASVAPRVQALAGKIGDWDYQIAKAFMAGVPAARGDELADAYRALPSTADDVRRYAQRVAEPNEDLAPLPPQRTLGLVRSDQAATIEQLTGLPATGYDFSVDPSAIGHILREHADIDVQRRQNQRAVTTADFARLALVLNGPDYIGLAGVSDMGEQVIEIRRAFMDGTFVTRWAVRGRKRRTVALKTMFIETE